MNITDIIKTRVAAMEDDVYLSVTDEVFEVSFSWLKYTVATAAEYLEPIIDWAEKAPYVTIDNMHEYYVTMSGAGMVSAHQLTGIKPGDNPRFKYSSSGNWLARASAVNDLIVSTLIAHVPHMVEQLPPFLSLVRLTDVIAVYPGVKAKKFTRKDPLVFNATVRHSALPYRIVCYFGIPMVLPKSIQYLTVDQTGAIHGFSAEPQLDKDSLSWVPPCGKSSVYFGRLTYKDLKKHGYNWQDTKVCVVGHDEHICVHGDEILNYVKHGIISDTTKKQLENMMRGSEA